MTGARRCILCGSDQLSTLLKFDNLPISHNLRRSQDDPDPRFSVGFESCPRCGLLQIAEPISPDLLYAHADTYTTGFQKPRHLDDLITTAVALQDPDSAIDIGCNDGALMEALTRGGYAKVVGVEPNGVAAGLARQKGYPVHADFLGPDLADRLVQEHGAFGVAYMRHVVEHVGDTASFFAAVRRLLCPGGLLVMELPEVETAFALGSPAILWEEHVSYYTREQAEHLLARFGFEILDRRRYAFGGGSIACIARMVELPAAGAALAGPDAGASRAVLLDFARRLERQKLDLHGLVADARKAGWKVIMYGAAPRSCMVSAAAGISGLIDFVVDDRQDIQGRLMPGTERPIRPLADVAAEAGPDILYLLGVGAENEFKVRARIAAVGKARAAFVSLLPPRDTVGTIATARKILVT